jgi:hypothetical protein
MERFATAFRYLFNYFYGGLLTFKLLTIYRDEVTRRKIEEDQILISTMIIGANSHSALVLANVLKKHDDSIHLEYVFNLLRISEAEFENKTNYNNLITIADNLLSQLENYKEIIDDLINKRDTGFAHLDRALVNDPKKLDTTIENSWVKFGELYEIINEGLTSMLENMGGDPNFRYYQPLAYLELINDVIKALDIFYSE